MESLVEARAPEPGLVLFRLWQKGDAPATAGIFDLAFGPGRYAKTAERLREGNRHLEGFSLVAEECRGASGIVGAALVWPILIGTKPAGLLGPIAILPRLHGQGLGRKLLAATLAQADATTTTDREVIGEGILLVGDLAWYGPFGFVGVGDRVQLPGPVNPDRILLRPKSGTDAAAGKGAAGQWGGLAVPAFRNLRSG